MLTKDKEREREKGKEMRKKKVRVKQENKWGTGKRERDKKKQNKILAMINEINFLIRIKSEQLTTFIYIHKFFWKKNKWRNMIYSHLFFLMNNSIEINYLDK